MKGTKPGIARNRSEVSFQRVRELFSYREDGNLIWLPILEENRHHRRRNTLFANKVAGYVNKDVGYKLVKLDGYGELLHRLIFLYHKGYLPAVVDHADGDTYNNRIENLRGGDQYKNSLNSKMKSSNISGVKCVHWHTRDRCWEAAIRVEGKALYLGRFDSLDEAEEIVRIAREKHHGEFANHG